MSNKGMTQTAETRRKISLENTKDRTETYKKIAEYIAQLKENDFPSITKACIHARIRESELLSHELRTGEDSEIRYMLDDIRQRQKEYLMMNGLNKTNDSRMTIFLLKANHNLKEEQPNLIQNNTFNVSPELLAEAIQITRTKKPANKRTNEIESIEEE
jgi:hypothetical protein